MSPSRMARMIALAMDHRRGEPKSQELLALEAESEAEELDREKGKNPVAFLLKRIDLSAAPFPIFLDIEPLSRFTETTKVRLIWLPDGDREYVDEYEDSPVTDFFGDDPAPLSVSVTVKRRKARKLADGFELDQHMAFNKSEFMAQAVVSIVRSKTGYRPPIKPELEVFRGL